MKKTGKKDKHIRNYQNLNTTEKFHHQNVINSFKHDPDTTMSIHTRQGIKPQYMHVNTLVHVPTSGEPRAATRRHVQLGL